MSDGEASPQALVNMRNGDKILLDLSGVEEFGDVVKKITNSDGWVFFADRVLFKVSEVLSVYYLEKGYVG